jgi:hypothetical protein
MGGNFNNQFPSLSWISKGGNKDHSIYRMVILFFTLFKLRKLFMLIGAENLVHVPD